jgi:hypothetical protein
MSTAALLDRLRTLGISPDAHADTWLDGVDLLAALDAIGRSGCCVLIKVDGLRTNGAVYTIVISGGFLVDEVFRKDGPDLVALAGAAIAHVIDRLATNGARPNGTAGSTPARGSVRIHRRRCVARAAPVRTCRFGTARYSTAGSNAICTAPRAAPTTFC